MPAKKISNKKINKKQVTAKDVFIGLSVLGNIVFVLLFVGFLSGMFDWYLANYSIGQLTDVSGCFRAQDKTVKQDGMGRAIDKDGKIVCVRTLAPAEVK